MGKDHELLEAARTGNLSLVEKLLSAKSKSSTFVASFGIRVGPNVNCQDQNGYTPLHHAALNGHSSIVELLLHAHALANVADSKGSAPLHLAAWNGKSEIVRILLTNGPSFASVNEQNGDKETALHCASQHGHKESVKILLDNHADPCIRNMRDESALDLASQYGRLEVVRLLLTYHPKLLAHSPERFTPLHLASRNGHRCVVELLLVHGADINKVGANGTALHEAALFGKYDVVSLLLKRGAETGAKDASGRSPLELVSQLDTIISRDIAKLIIARIQEGDDYVPMPTIAASTPQRLKKRIPLIPKIPDKNLSRKDSEEIRDFNQPMNVFTKPAGTRVSRHLSRSFGEADAMPRGRPQSPLSKSLRYSRSSPMSPENSRSPGGSHRIRIGLLRRSSSARSARSLPRATSSSSFHGNRSLHSFSAHGKKSEANPELSIHQHHPSIDMFPVTPTASTSHAERTPSISLPSSPQMRPFQVSPINPDVGPALVAHDNPFHADDDNVFLPCTPTGSQRPSLTFETFLPQKSFKAEPKIVPLKPPAEVPQTVMESVKNVSQPSLTTTATSAHSKLSIFVPSERPPPLPKKSSSTSPPLKDEDLSPPLPTKQSLKFDVDVKTQKDKHEIEASPIPPERSSKKISQNIKTEQKIAETLPTAKPENTEQTGTRLSSGVIPSSVSSASDLSPGLRSPSAPTKPQRHKVAQSLPPPLPPKPAHMMHDGKKPRPPSPSLPPPDDDLSDETGSSSDERQIIGAEVPTTSKSSLTKNESVIKPASSPTATPEVPTPIHESTPVSSNEDHKAPTDTPKSSRTHIAKGQAPSSPTSTPGFPITLELTPTHTTVTPTQAPTPNAQKMQPVEEKKVDPKPSDPSPDSKRSSQLSPRSPSPPFSPPSPQTAMLQVSSTLQKAISLERIPGPEKPRPQLVKSKSLYERQKGGPQDPVIPLKEFNQQNQVKKPRVKKKGPNLKSVKNEPSKGQRSKKDSKQPVTPVADEQKLCKNDQNNQLRSQNDLQFSATEVKRARIRSTKSVTEQNVMSQSYSDYDNLNFMMSQNGDEKVVHKTRRSVSLGPTMGPTLSIMPSTHSLKMRDVGTQKKSPVLKSDAYTQTFPPKVSSQRKKSLRKSKSFDVYRNSKEETLPLDSIISISSAVYTRKSNSAEQVRAKKKGYSKEKLSSYNTNASNNRSTSRSPQKRFTLKEQPKNTSKEHSTTSKLVEKQPEDASREPDNVFLEAERAGHGLGPSHLEGQASISVLSLDTSDDWNDALSDQTEDMAIPASVRKFRGLIRGSSLSYRSRFTSCGAREPAYDSDEFEYDYNFDSKEAYSRVNASLQPDDEVEPRDLKYTTVVTKESVTNTGGFYSTQTQLGQPATQVESESLMDSDSHLASQNTSELILKPSNYLIGEPGEKRRKEEQSKFTQLLLLHNNPALSKNTVTSQGGIINYALTTPTHSRDSSYDNNNNNNNTDSTDGKTEESSKTSTTISTTHKTADMSVPTLPSPMSDGIPDFGAIVETVTAVRSKVSPQGSTSGVSSSSSSKSSTLAKQDQETVEGTFNENDEWAQIANMMKSVGSSLNKGPVYAQEFEETFWRIMTGSDLPRKVGTWLSDLNLSQYEEVLCGNGFDNIKFLASDILEEQDLVDMNIMNASHRKRMLDSAKNLPKIRRLGSLSAGSDGPQDQPMGPSSVSEWLHSLDLEELDETFKMMGILTLERAKKMKDTEIAALVSLRGHRKRIRASLGHHSPQRAGVTRSTSQTSNSNRSSSRSRLKSSPPLPRSPLLDKVNFFKDYSQKTFGNTVKSNTSAPSSGAYSTGTSSSSSSALTNYSSLSDQVVPVAITEEPSSEVPDRRSRTRNHRNQSSSRSTESRHRRQSKEKPADTNTLATQENEIPNFVDSNEEQDSLTLAISRLTETSSQNNVQTLPYDNKENINMSTSDPNEIRVPDARRASYLSSTGGELVLRPPNETTEEVSISSWCHDPENLIKSCCNYRAFYLGSMLVREVKGVESTVEACAKMKKSTDTMKKIPAVTLSISYRGVKFIDDKSKHEIAEHEIHNISFASQDADDLSTLAYITRDARTGNHYCHVFRVTTLDVAYEIILTLGQAFEVAYQLILKEKAMQEGNI